MHIAIINHSQSHKIITHHVDIPKGPRHYTERPSIQHLENVKTVYSVTISSFNCIFCQISSFMFHRRMKAHTSLKRHEDQQITLQDSILIVAFFFFFQLSCLVLSIFFFKPLMVCGDMLDVHLFLQGKGGIHSLPDHGMRIAGLAQLHAACGLRRPGTPQAFCGRTGTVPLRTLKLHCMKDTVRETKRLNSTSNSSAKVIKDSCLKNKNTVDFPSLGPNQE